jgi:hypothetical protein
MQNRNSRLRNGTTRVLEKRAALGESQENLCWEVIVRFHEEAWKVARITMQQFNGDGLRASYTLQRPSLPTE